MAQVLGIHEIELKPGVAGEEFERYFTQEVVPANQIPGVQLRLLKGDRGERAGRYAVLFEVESVELRARYWPQHGVETEEVQQYTGELEAVLARWEQLASGIDDNFTDYVVVG